MTEKIRIQGGQPLYGQVEIPAAKNSVLPILAALPLCEGTVYLQNIPHLSDVEDILSLLREAGLQVGWQGRAICATAPRPNNGRLVGRAAERMRASILLSAPLLAKLGRVELPLPGGCKIGARPIDLHKEGLSRMGAQVEEDEKKLVLTAPHGLHGAVHALRFPSVGATETLLLAGVTAEGETVITGAAREPEIVDLALFLGRCGAEIEGAGSNVIRIVGKKRLTGCLFSPLPDRIFAATIACGVAIAGGRVRLKGCPISLFSAVLTQLERMGCKIEGRKNMQIEIERCDTLYGIGKIQTGSYPQLATDAAPLLAAALLCARGESQIEDKIFEERFVCAEGFTRMGAAVRRNGRTLEIQAVPKLYGTTVTATDLRGGAALVLAALGAEGITQIEQAQFLGRGYERLEETLAGLGAETIQIKERN